MLKKMLANTMGKKALVFMLVFALTGVLMGNTLVSFSDSNPDEPTVDTTGRLDLTTSQDEVDTDVLQQESGDLEGFQSLVQRGRSAGDGEPESSEEPQDSTGAPEGESAAQEAAETQEESEFVYHSSIPLSEELQEYTFYRCQELEIEYELILAIMWRESRFTVNAVGYNRNGTRDNGIMQINDVNRPWLEEEFGITDLMDPYQNIDAGTGMLAKWLHKYEDENMALMAYHLGEAGMLRKMEQGITTNQGVRVAQEKRDSYRKLLQRA